MPGPLARFIDSGGSLRRALLLAAGAALLLGAGIGNHGFWVPDEPFVAEIAQEMLLSGDWVVPQLNGVPFLEKPPLYYAADAASFHLFGVTPFAARLPSALAGLLTVLATYALGKRTLGESTAILGALILCTTYMFLHAAGYCIVDSALCLFVVLAFLCLSLAGAGDLRRHLAIPAAFLAAALAFLVKGPIGPIIIFAGSALLVLVDRRALGERPSRRCLAGAAVFAVVAGSWVLALWQRGGMPYLHEALIANSLGRFTQLPSLLPANVLRGEHAFPWYDYFLSTPSAFLPWSPLLVLAALGALRRPTEPPPAVPAVERQLWLPVLAALVILSAATAKRSIYLLPVYPQLALLGAHSLRQFAAAAARPGWLERSVVTVQLLVVTVLFGGTSYAVYTLAGPWFGRPPQTGYTVTALALGLAAVTVAASGWNHWYRDRKSRLVQNLCLQAVAAVLILTQVCVPLLDDEFGAEKFFVRAESIERARNRLPLLLVGSENGVGLAGLHFGVRPRLRPEDLAAADGNISADLLVDTAGLRTLRLSCGASVRVLATREGDADSPRTVYLVSFDRSPGAACSLASR